MPHTHPAEEVMDMVMLGAILIIAGLAVLVIEAHASTAGLLGGVGVLTAAAGLGVILAGSGVTLFVTIPVSVVLALAGVAAMAMVAGEVVLARRRPVSTGPEAMEGKVATVQTWSGDRGQVAADGTLWSAQLAYGWEDPEPKIGETVIISDLDGLSVTIRRPTPWEVTPRWKPSWLS